MDRGLQKKKKKNEVGDYSGVGIEKRGGVHTCLRAGGRSVD